MNPDTKKILFFGGLILFGISVWKILKGKSPKKAVKETIQAPIDITAKVVETVIEPLKKDDPVDKATEHPDVLGAGAKKRKSKKIADSRTRWHYAQKHFNKGFTQLTLAEAQLVNSDMVAHGYKLSKDEPTKKEIKKELKEMHKSKHKGHKTKRGLSQDQKRKSKESWEKSYRKNKEAAK
jgi:hypothetical protein